MMFLVGMADYCFAPIETRLVEAFKPDERVWVRLKDEEGRKREDTTCTTTGGAGTGGGVDPPCVTVFFLELKICLSNFFITCL